MRQLTWDKEFVQKKTWDKELYEKEIVIYYFIHMHGSLLSHNPSSTIDSSMSQINYVQKK